MKRYYMLEQDGNAASVTIYGDITSWPWEESDVSAYLLSKQIDGIDAALIDVYINSYGGEVAEGLAIYNALRRHKAKVITHCDGFACSAASVVFMAGDERLMNNASLLMIHNAWNYACGNAAELRKIADDLETISTVAANAYRESINIDDDQLEQLLAEERWINPQDAVDMGFATGIESGTQNRVPTANAREIAMGKLLQKMPATVTNIDINTDELAEKVAAALIRPAGNDNRHKTLMDALMRRKETK